MYASWHLSVRKSKIVIKRQGPFGRLQVAHRVSSTTARIILLLTNQPLRWMMWQSRLWAA